MHLSEVANASQYFADYDLGILREDYRRRDPAPHQNSALTKLRDWYSSRNDAGRGGILVLPTGGGKTFTAVHFACAHPLSDGAKVLWLAHTHHLLEQAFESFAGSAGSVREPKPRLNIRLISGMGGEHFPVQSVRTTDDVVISSLPTACRAFQHNHPALVNFLDASAGHCGGRSSAGPPKRRSSCSSTTGNRESSGPSTTNSGRRRPRTTSANSASTRQSIWFPSNWSADSLARWTAARTSTRCPTGSTSRSAGTWPSTGLAWKGPTTTSRSCSKSWSSNTNRRVTGTC